jgi:AcrR family transcriptional regulator
VTKQAEDGAGSDVEIEVAEGPEVAEALAEAVGLDATLPLGVRSLYRFVVHSTGNASSTVYDMARAKPTPRAAQRDVASAMADEITERVLEKVNKKVAEKISQKVAAKVGRDADALDRLAAHLDALDVWTRGAGSSRKPRFTREDIAATAVRIADEEGLEAVSMRRLASELGAGTMTLYHYVQTKDELLTLVNDAVMGEVLVPPDTPLPRDWRAAVTLIAERTRACLQRHPWLLDMADDPQIGPNAVRHFDQTLEAVSSLGLPLVDLLDVVTMVDEYVFGYCIHERNNLHPDDDGAGPDFSQGMGVYIEGLLATGEYPQLQRLTAELGVAGVLEAVSTHAHDAGRFGRNLSRLLDGIEADLQRKSKRR